MSLAKRNIIVADDLERITQADLPWEQFRNKTVLVTGASGFLPAYMVETLLYLNETRNLSITVIALIRNFVTAEARFAHYAGRTDLQLVCQDIKDPLTLTGHTVHIIIHAASQASPKFYGTDPVGTLLPNTIGTANLLEYSRIHPVENFLFFSSGEVYGEVDISQVPLTETSYGFVDPMLVRSCYAESKRMGETMCAAWHHQYGVPVKVVRPFHTYGPGMRLDDGRVFADFVADIIHERDIHMKSAGDVSRAFCYLSDAVTGFFTVLLKGENGQAYNIANSDAEITIIDLAELLVKIFPEKSLLVVRQQRTDTQAYLQSKILRACPDIGKAMALGWNPTIGIEQGFTLTVRSYL